ncbi:hypothetical protein HNQ64_003692 [Prosthecobacter dejongeii]|uniref:Uncharacterized protein n=1 Tax=Prosthecobacter dejongeii TaxID=48465 RepID=A0A7W7YNW1_9BACT|nr:hypothetical protein [Prosthecobacter dejongeii]
MDFIKDPWMPGIQGFFVWNEATIHLNGFLLTKLYWEEVWVRVSGRVDPPIKMLSPRNAFP